MESIRVFCPASVANVSCGFDVLGFCLGPIGDEMVVRKSMKKGIKITKIEGQELPSDPQKNVAGVAALALLDKHPVSFGFEIEIYKNIKPGSGIGSSAASAAGAVFAINELIGKPYSRSELVQFAMAGEKLASGSAHADNLAPVLLGGFTLVRCNDTLDIIKLPSPKELYASLIHPKIELKTAHARAILKKEITLKQGIQQWGNLGAFISALYTEDYELLSRAMVDKVIEPARAMLIPEFESIRQSALKAGALGSGISGSGPSIYALSRGKAKAKKVGQAMLNATQNLAVEVDFHLSPINLKGISILETK
jgi:homoserine kinase